jgi:hypothetical protein
MPVRSKRAERIAAGEKYYVKGWGASVISLRLTGLLDA